jgi:hypothetical protein
VLTEYDASWLGVVQPLCPFPPPPPLSVCVYVADLRLRLTCKCDLQWMSEKEFNLRIGYLHSLLLLLLSPLFLSRHSLLTVPSPHRAPFPLPSSLLCRLNRPILLLLPRSHPGPFFFPSRVYVCTCAASVCYCVHAHMHMYVFASVCVNVCVCACVSSPDVRPKALSEHSVHLVDDNMRHLEAAGMGID